MKLPRFHSLPSDRLKRRSLHGFTLVEVLVTCGIAVMILAAAMAFMNFAAISMSGITTQSTVNDQAAHTIQFIQSRARIATSVSNDAAGTILTLGFDDNYKSDSNTNGLAYDDVDHVEKFQIIGSSTNIQSSTNSLVYIPATGPQKILIPTGVCKLPGRNIFRVTNSATVLIRFAIVDTYARGRYQSIDIQATAVPLNRSFPTNMITILP